ncbi:MAG TPA: CBS domain-containing protein [Candidatus Omnitrophota bacterium]|nr:hypothetical protein [Candidatus Omnitrophota bacterium]HRK61602.1 CBS domain-containing protein [Candidatus Omnitrophota bacterium]
MRDILLKEIMVQKVIVAHVKDSLSSVEEKMRLYKIRHLPVVDSDNKLIGIVTYRDLLTASPPHRTEEGFVFDKEQMDQFILKGIMTESPQTLTTEDTIAHAVAMMARDKFGCIPIVDSEKVLVGIVTQIDILKWLGKNL